MATGYDYASVGITTLMGLLVADEQGKSQAAWARYHAQVEKNQLIMQAQVYEQNAALAKGEMAGVRAASTRKQLDAEGKLTGLRGAQKVAMASSGFAIKDKTPQNRRAVASYQRDVRMNEVYALREKLLRSNALVNQAKAARHGANLAVRAGEHAARQAKTDTLIQQSAIIASAANTLVSRSVVPEKKPEGGSGYMQEDAWRYQPYKHTEYRYGGA